MYMSYYKKLYLYVLQVCFDEIVALSVIVSEFLSKLLIEVFLFLFDYTWVLISLLKLTLLQIHLETYYYLTQNRSPFHLGNPRPLPSSRVFELARFCFIVSERV